MIKGINHITLAVRNIETSFAFYHKILGFTPLCKWENGAYFLVGELWFCLNLDTLRVPAPCYTHYAFSVSEEVFEKLSQHIIEAGAQIFKQNTSPGKSLYFLDPDGHKLEIHAGDWKSRVQLKKREPGDWRHVQWFI